MLHIDLTGKTVLVTGASRGIGAAIARAMSTSGARVAVHYAKSVAAAEALASHLTGSRAFQADLADAADCQRLWSEALAWAGRIDVVVNNAGVALSSPMQAATSDWIEAWDRTLAVNLRAAALLCRSGVEHFVEQGGGRIINIASRAAFRGDQPAYLAYAASKAGLVALTRSIARGYGKDGVTAFDIAPGFTRTEMAQDFIDQYGEAFAVGDIALGRLTEPGDIAPLAVFLASGLADHATGTTIDINAGSYVH